MLRTALRPVRQVSFSDHIQMLETLYDKLLNIELFYYDNVFQQQNNYSKPLIMDTMNSRTAYLHVEHIRFPKWSNENSV